MDTNLRFSIWQSRNMPLKTAVKKWFALLSILKIIFTFHQLKSSSISLSLCITAHTERQRYFTVPFFPIFGSRKVLVSTVEMSFILIKSLRGWTEFSENRYYFRNYRSGKMAFLPNLLFKKKTILRLSVSLFITIPLPWIVRVFQFL